MQQCLKLPRLLAFLLLALAALLAAPSSALAQTTGGDMLFLSTKENSSNQPVIDNAWNAFALQANAMGLNPVDGRTLLSGASGLGIGPNTKMVVVVSANSPISAASMGELITAIETRPDLVVVIFVDGCCFVPQNLDPLITTINNTIKPANWAVPLALGPIYGPVNGNPTTYTAPLNTHSLYAPTFAAAGLNNLIAGIYTPINNVPLPYALYTQYALGASPTDPVQNVVGLFIPQRASNGGNGACLFLTADASEFTNAASHQTEYAKIATAFTNAALDPNGACAQPVAGAPDLSVTLTGLEDLETGGGPYDLTMTVSNADQAAAPATTVTLTVPGWITVNAPIPADCSTTATPNVYTCDVPALIASASHTYVFSISTPNSDTGFITAQVTPVTGEISTANNYAEVPVVVPGDSDVTSDITGPAILNVGTPGTYTVTFTNSGELDSLPATVTITLPAGTGTQIDTTAPLPYGCTTGSGDTVLTCPLESLSPLEIVTWRFAVIASAPFITGTITVTVEDGDGDDDSASDSSMDIRAVDTPAQYVDLTSSITGPAALTVGATGSYTVTVTNIGTHDSSSTATVTIMIPAEMAFVPSSLPGTCTETDPTTLSCLLATPIAANGGTATIPFAVTLTQAYTRERLIYVEVNTSDESLLSLKLNNNSQIGISATDAALSATPVPALDAVALMLLALLMAGGAAVRVPRRKGNSS